MTDPLPQLNLRSRIAQTVRYIRYKICQIRRLWRLGGHPPSSIMSKVTFLLEMAVPVRGVAEKEKNTLL